MSQNVDAGVRVLECFNRRDLDGFLACMDEEIEYLPRFRPEGTHRGHEGMRRWWADLVDVMPNVKIEVLGWRESGEITVGHMRLRGHGAGSDVSIDEDNWQVARWRDGKCVWACSYGTERDALEAAGLSE